MDEEMDEYMRELWKKTAKDAEENMAWLCSIDAEISDINPLTLGNSEDHANAE